MRDAFARAITEAARTRDDVILVVADISPAAALKTFLDENPTRIVDVGVSEQAMIGMAAVPLRISESTPGAILQPQPPPCDKLVRRGSVAGRAAVAGTVMAVQVGKSDTDYPASS